MGAERVQRRPITDELRASVLEDLPEVNDIADPGLRSKVIEGWAYAIAGSSFQKSGICLVKGIRTSWFSDGATRPNICEAWRNLR